MSVPGRIGTILIVALALLDALMLFSGARHAATTIESHAFRNGPTRPAPVSAHDTLLASALREIALLSGRTSPQGHWGV